MLRLFDGSNSVAGWDVTHGDVPLLELGDIGTLGENEKLNLLGELAPGLGLEEDSWLAPLSCNGGYLKILLDPRWDMATWIKSIQV